MSTSPYTAVAVRVAAVQDVCSSVRRVTLAGEGLHQAASLCLDRRIKLVLPRHAGDTLDDVPQTPGWYAGWLALPDDRRPAVRTYTARDVRPAAGELDVEVVRHGTTGPAGRWIEQVAIGDALVVAVPRAEVPGIDTVGLAWHPGGARQVLVAGDETAAPAIANIAAALPADAVGTILLELPSEADHWPVAAPPGVEVRLLPRQGQRPGQLLEREVASIAWPPVPTAPPARVELSDDDLVWDEPAAGADGEHFAWLAGECGAVKRMRRCLVTERGCPRDRVAFMGYWRQGAAQA